MKSNVSVIMEINCKTQVFIMLLCLCIHHGCHTRTPTEQPLDNLINTLKGENISDIQKFFVNPADAHSFPLYKALKEGSSWLGLMQVQSLDHHLIFDIDLRSPPPDEHRQRYTFWGRAPQFQAMTKDSVDQSGFITGWSNPHTISTDESTFSHLNLPNRFASTAYRMISAHREQTKIKSQALGVIGKEGSGALESGWTGSFELHSTRLKKMSRRHRSCQKVRKNWPKYLSVLQNNLSAQCLKPLLFAAQRHRYIDLSLLSDRIDVSQGRGGQKIRAKQDQKILKKFLTADHSQSKSEHEVADELQFDLSNSVNGVAFNGRITLQQSLEFAPQQRISPTMIEAMVVAPPLTQCVQSVTDRWSSDFLKQDTCQYTLSILFSVSESNP